MNVRVITGDCRYVLRSLESESVHCVVTSPPYWGLRDYGVAGGIGLENTLDEHLAAVCAVFAEVWRVLRPDGTLWLNYGDAYAGSWGAQGRGDKRSEMEIGGRIEGHRRKTLSEQQIIAHPRRHQTGSLKRTGLKAKDLMGLPWRIAFALQDAGWWLRQDIIWSKPNPMPESVTNRCTKAHEYLFLLSKADRYYFDQDAIRETATDTGRTNGRDGRDEDKRARPPGSRPRTLKRLDYSELGRNKRSVWEVATQPFSEAHFATFPLALVEPCILAGCPPRGTVLDPFFGAGTVGLVADRLQRNCIGIELNPAYAAMAERRIRGDAPMFAEVAP